MKITVGEMKRLKNLKKQWKYRKRARGYFMTDEKLLFMLRELKNKIDGLESCALVAKEGLIVASLLEEGVSEYHIAAMSAIILTTCDRVLVELKKGDLDLAIVQGSDGKFICMGCGEENILAVVLAEDAPMDIVFVEMRTTATKIVEYLEELDI